MPERTQPSLHSVSGGSKVNVVYIGLLEVRPRPGCEAVDADVKGAVARCYAVAGSTEDALARMRKVLTDLGFAVVGIEFCSSYEGTDWENPDGPEGKECALEARETGQVIVGRLDAWTSDDE